MIFSPYLFFRFFTVFILISPVLEGEESLVFIEIKQDHQVLQAQRNHTSSKEVFCRESQRIKIETECSGITGGTNVEQRGSCTASRTFLCIPNLPLCIEFQGFGGNQGMEGGFGFCRGKGQIGERKKIEERERDRSEDQGFAQFFLYFVFYYFFITLVWGSRKGSPFKPLFIIFSFIYMIYLSWGSRRGSH